MDSECIFFIDPVLSILPRNIIYESQKITNVSDICLIFNNFCMVTQIFCTSGWRLPFSGQRLSWGFLFLNFNRRRQSGLCSVHIYSTLHVWQTSVLVSNNLTISREYFIFQKHFYSAIHVVYRLFSKYLHIPK